PPRSPAWAWCPRTRPFSPASFAPTADVTTLASISATSATPTTPRRNRIMPTPLRSKGRARRWAGSRDVLRCMAASRNRQCEPVELGHLHLAPHAPAIDRRHDFRELLRRIGGEDKALAGAPLVDVPRPVGELGP